MKDASFFFDTNILLYLLSGDNEKAACVEAIVSKNGIISVQVLNEFASVASRKLGMTYAEIREYLVTIRTVCDVRPLTVETHLLGLDIAERYGFSFYDSLIVGAALLADCSTLYSEDMQHGQKIENSIVIANPFLAQI
ncbi:PIN domain-containing protein [Methylicorpusculum oleiharenae]|uniref:PIN domain-containing protein n=1 Tax=Methylicorpusculum oleiharenae TaxID=1338687 RepID=UPI0013583DAE|nr:PIN domain-containing protein [Methylicorpusculum oleiharenae]MCD2452393.1 PIN domain-containing protein [Methylicorpusculum oleiharenae]